MKIVFESSTIVVYVNSSEEVIVELKQNHISVRVTPNVEHISVTSQNGIMTPWSVNGLPAIKVTK